MTIPAFDTALTLLSKSKDPVSDIIRTSAYWIPLQFVYCEMCKNKDLIPISELPRDKKDELWDYVRFTDWDRWKKITVCQAIYTYEYLTK